MTRHIKVAGPILAHSNVADISNVRETEVFASIKA